MTDKKLSPEEHKKIGARLNEIIEARGLKKNVIAPQIFNDGRHKNPDQYLSKLLGGGGEQTPTVDYEAVMNHLGVTWDTLYLAASLNAQGAYLHKNKYELKLLSLFLPGYKKYINDLKSIENIKDENVKKAAQDSLIKEAFKDLKDLLE